MSLSLNYRLTLGLVYLGPGGSVEACHQVAWLKDEARAHTPRRQPACPLLATCVAFPWLPSHATSNASAPRHATAWLPCPPLPTLPSFSADLDLSPAHVPALQLDAAPLQLILSKLDPASLRAAAASCRHFRELSRDVAPGLKLTLFPHQVGPSKSCAVGSLF